MTRLGRVTRQTVSEMTYNVSSGTLNSTIPYLYVCVSCFVVWTTTQVVASILAGVCIFVRKCMDWCDTGTAELNDSSFFLG